MNVVVTGATSFLGAALVKELLGRGHEVYGVQRPHSPNRQVLECLREREDGKGRNLHIIELELEELDGIDRMIPVPCQVFFHFGWGGSGSQSRLMNEVQRKNVEDSVKALCGARRLGCRRFLFSGSQAEYGVYRTPMREDMPVSPVSEYGKAKVEFGLRAKSMCRQWRETGEWEMEYIHIRIFSVYGPGDHPWSLVNTCLDTFLKGGVMELGACSQQWNFLYIEDLVEGVMALAFCDKPACGETVYNLAGGEEDTRVLKSYVEEMHRLCGGEGTCVYGILPPNAEGSTNLIPDIGRIRERTGWEPRVSFEEGIRHMINRRLDAERPIQGD